MRRLLFVLLLLASSCGQNPKSIFRVGISVFPAYEFLHLSDDLNLLPRDEIKLVDISIWATAAEPSSCIK